MKSLKMLALLAALPISFAVADNYVARGEREGEWGGERNYKGGQEGQYNRPGATQGNTYNRSGTAEYHNSEYQNEESAKGYSGNYDNAGSAARGYANGYERGESNYQGNQGYATPVYVQPPTYGAPPQNSYNSSIAPN